MDTAPPFHQVLECTYLSFSTGSKHRGHTILHCVREEVKRVFTYANKVVDILLLSTQQIKKAGHIQNQSEKNMRADVQVCVNTEARGRCIYVLGITPSHVNIVLPYQECGHCPHVPPST